MLKRIIICVIALALVTATMPGCKAVATSGNNLTYGNTIGNKAYDFSLPDLNNNFISLSSLKGHPVVLNFWSIT